MKVLGLLAVVLFSLNAFSHGEIERINCLDKKSKSVLTAVEQPEVKGQKDDLYRVQVKKGAETVLTETGVKLELKDTVKGTTVFENITMDLKSGRTAKIVVKEDYKLAERPGTGTLTLAKNNEITFAKCVAVYDLD